MSKHISVAIDGPSGAGKSTIARAAAKRFGLIYVDTGAMYRTVALAIHRAGADCAEKDAVLPLLPSIQIGMDYDARGVQRMLLDGEDVSEAIRTPENSTRASQVSAFPEVRAFLMDTQRNFAKENSVVMDGRDIGTVVLPDATLKIFLTASAEKRARRRCLELQEKGMDVRFEQVLRDIEERDYNDTHRAAAPLKKAEDALEIDTSDLTLEESIDAVCAEISRVLERGKLFVAKSAGFCFGVSRSVKLAEQMLSEEDSCCSFGELIHNADVVQRLEQRGLRVVSDPAEVHGDDAVIVRSHGITKAVFDSLCATGAKVIDATCPKVKRIHQLVAEASEEGRRPIIVGAADHPEVQAICGWCTDPVVVADAEELAKKLHSGVIDPASPVTMVIQTTQTQEKLSDCKNLLKKECTNAKIYDTICGATSTRQAEAEQLARSCEAMVVIGGKHSANSRHLYEICCSHCAHVQFIENAAQLDLSALDHAKTVGLTAGASVPAWIIKEVKETMTDEILSEETVETPIEAPVEAPVEEAAVEAAPAVEEAPVEEAVPVVEEAAPAADAEETFDALLEASLKPVHNGDKVTGTVVAISGTEISVDIGAKYSGFIPTSEFTDDGVKVEDVIHVGDEIEAQVVRVNDVEGTAMLSKKRLDAVKHWQVIEEAQESGEVVEGVVTEENKGGVVVNVKGIRVFVPASQSGLPKDKPMTELVKQNVRLKITEVNRGRKRVVGSIRAVLQKERRERAEKVWNEIEVGKQYHGVVKSLTSYGAFIDIGGIDGMAHVSELSWSRIKSPAEVLNVGDEVDVYVISFDAEKRRISLGYKDPNGNPWTKFTSTYQVGDVAKVTVVKLMPFGAFAEVLPGVDGLIHISQIANRRIGKPEDVLTVGDVVDAKITAVDEEKHKISLSIRALSQPEPAPERREVEEEVYDDSPEAPEEDALVYEVSATGEATGNIPADAAEEE